VVINARGRVLGAQAGTGDIDVLRETIALGLQTIGGPVDTSTKPGSEPAIPTNAASGMATVARLPLPEGDLAFPTSVAVLSSGELVVADYGNNRLLAFRPSRDMRRATAVADIGGFDRPYRVLADATDGVYVTEPAVGSVSYLDLQAKTRRLLTEDLVAPTGMCVDSDGSVVIADSGAEQLYRLINEGPHSVTMGLIAGSGSTGSSDGGAADAGLAQPTGIARTEVGLVFCDSAASNVRLLTDYGKIATITGNGFFDWGLVDGPAHKAMLQRPSDLAVLADGSIMIADTGNNRLRRLTSRRIRTLGLAGLNRPAGVTATKDGQLIIADTGNNRLVVVDTDLQTAWPLRLDGVLPPIQAVPPTSATGSRTDTSARTSANA
jgi:DNA-binding beta-propeller fold protein YncE